MKLGKLTLNELQKQLKKISTVVIICIFIVICFFGPLISVLFENLFDGIYDTYQDYIDFNNEEISNYKDLSAEETTYFTLKEIEVRISLLEASNKAYNTAVVNGVEIDSWRSPYVESLERCYQEAAALQYYLNEDEIAKQYLYMYDFQGLSQRQLQARYDANMEYIKQYVAYIVENDLKRFAENEIISIQDKLSPYNSAYALYLETAEKLTEHEKLYYDTYYNSVISALELYIQAYELMIDCAEKDGNNECKEIFASFEYINKALDYAEYYFSAPDNYHVANSIPYERHCRNFKTEFKRAMDDARELLYAQTNNYTDFREGNTTRALLISYKEMFIFVTLFGIFLASSIVSSEHSRKTVNLLLIRPVKRWKIITAKYLSLLIIAFSMLFAGGIAWTVMSGIASGFGDIFQPYIYTFGDTVTHTSFIFWSLGQLALCSASVIFAISLTFMFSTLTKGTAVSAILGSVAILGGNFLHTIIFAILPMFIYIPWYAYTPLPYLNMANLIADRDSVFAISFGSQLMTNGFEANIYFGAGLLIILSALTLLLSIRVFGKRDIK